MEALVLLLEKEDRGQRDGQWVAITCYLHLTLCGKVPFDVLTGRSYHLWGRHVEQLSHVSGVGESR